MYHRNYGQPQQGGGGHIVSIAETYNSQRFEVPPPHATGYDPRNVIGGERSSRVTSLLWCDVRLRIRLLLECASCMCIN